MRYRPLGRTELPVSAVSMGAWKLFDVRGQSAIPQVYGLVTEVLRRQAK